MKIDMYSSGNDTGKETESNNELALLLFISLTNTFTLFTLGFAQFDGDRERRGRGSDCVIVSCSLKLDDALQLESEND